MNGNPTILIVDNDTGARKRLSATFKKGGFEVLAVGTANEAIAAARERRFNVVLLDIELPDMSGTELIASLKELQPDAAIVMVTADPTLDSAVRSINAGAQRYLTKPLNMDEVLATVTEVLEKQRLVSENGVLYEEVRTRRRTLPHDNRKHVRHRLGHGSRPQDDLHQPVCDQGNRIHT